MPRLERDFQAHVIRRVRDLIPEAVVIMNDPSYMQGIPDILILSGDRWAMLEVKASLASPSRPNQSFYVEQFNEMSFAAFICPENEEVILRALQRSFETSRTSRVSKRK
jgi:hypothetical protein